MESVKKTCKRVFQGRCKRCRDGGSRGRKNNIICKVRESLGKMTTNNKNKLLQHQQVPPQGCLWVYVGPYRERFLLKIEFANHPMFKILLDEAESEYGYKNEGPIWLPCDVNIFCEALEEMEEEKKMRSYSNSRAALFIIPVIRVILIHLCTHLFPIFLTILLLILQIITSF